MSDRGLLRLPDGLEPYPSEPSDEALAESLGLPLDQLLRFDMNTLGGGPLPAVASALATYDARRIVEYGDQAYRRLRAAIQAATAAPAHRIIPGAGGDELIRLVTGLVVVPGDAVTIPTPTFGMFAVEARLAGGQVVEVPRQDPGQQQDVRAIRAAAEDSGSRLVWLCSPNNPTGDAYAIEAVARLAEGLDAVVVVDTVYQELAEVSAGADPEALSLLPSQERLPNLVILRSLAKAYGLAGARVGYLVVPDALAARFEAARLPLAIGGPSEAAALGALSDPARRSRPPGRDRRPARTPRRRARGGWLARSCRRRPTSCSCGRRTRRPRRRPCCGEAWRSANTQAVRCSAGCASPRDRPPKTIACWQRSASTADAADRRSLGRGHLEWAEAGGLELAANLVRVAHHQHQVVVGPEQVARRRRGRHRPRHLPDASGRSATSRRAARRPPAARWPWPRRRLSRSAAGRRRPGSRGSPAARSRPELRRGRGSGCSTVSRSGIGGDLGLDRGAPR